MNKEDYFSEKKVLVTGASGFIGGALCTRLKELGSEIYAISTKSRKEAADIDHWITGNLVNLDFTRDVIHSLQPDYLFHLAGYVTGSRELKEVPLTYQNILTTTINILISSHEAEIKRIVLAGSLEEPDSSADDRIPVSPYAAAKCSASMYARMFHKLYETPIVIPRIFMVYGPGRQNTEKLVPYVIQSLIKQNKPQLTSGTRPIDWIYLEDVVEGLIRMALQSGVEGKTIDLGRGELYTVREICEHIQSQIKNDIKIEFGDLGDRPFERIDKADIDKTRELLGWEPSVGVEEGLQKTIAWFTKRVSEKKVNS